MDLTTALLLFLMVGQYGTDTLGGVKFSGNHAFSGRALAAVVTARARMPFVEATLSRDVGALERFYQDQGFFDVQVDKGLSRARRPVVTFEVTEGPRTRVSVIALSGNRSFGSDRLLRLLPVRPGQPAARSASDRGAQSLKSFYLNNGFPFAGVEGSLTRTDTLATLAFDLNEGPKCRIGAVRVRGNRTVRTATILRALEVKAGELFSSGRLNRAQTRLYATKLFSRVVLVVVPPDTTGAPADSHYVTVGFDVVEQPYKSVAFGAGMETPTNRLLLAAEWEHDNVLNRGQSVLVSAEYAPALSGDYRIATDATYRVPYLVLTRIDFQTRPFFSLEQIDTVRQREYGVETGMSRSLTPQFTAGVSNRLRFVSDPSGVTNSLGLNGQYDTRDDAFDPHHGVSIQSVAEVAGGLLQGRNDFYRLTGDARFYQDVGFGFVFAARAMAGRVIPYGRTRAVPYYESFTLGGRSSLRGYPDRSLGPDSAITGRYGSAVANANVELRTPYALGWVGLAGFVDIGNVGRNLRLFAYEYSAGAGIRVRTPIGPVRLDWGKRLRNPATGDKGRLYLGLLHAF
jgi:outer membrane protein assembly complex protein YaeT